jgi:hypothetical protein
MMAGNRTERLLAALQARGAMVGEHAAPKLKTRRQRENQAIAELFRAAEGTHAHKS